MTAQNRKDSKTQADKIEDLQDELKEKVDVGACEAEQEECQERICKKLDKIERTQEKQWDEMGDIRREHAAFLKEDSERTRLIAGTLGRMEQFMLDHGASVPKTGIKK